MQFQSTTIDLGDLSFDSHLQQCDQAPVHLVASPLVGGRCILAIPNPVLQIQILQVFFDLFFNFLLDKLLNKRRLLHGLLHCLLRRQLRTRLHFGAKF